MEDIYYVQQLFLGSNIPNVDKGKWVSPSGNLSEQLRNEVEELKQKIQGGEPSNLPATTVPNIQTPVPQPTIPASEMDFQAAEEVLEDDTLNINDMEKRNIIKSLQRNHYRRKEAADELGISVRTLYRKLKAYGIEE